jgi:hypothetical protein
MNYPTVFLLRSFTTEKELRRTLSLKLNPTEQISRYAALSGFHMCPEVSWLRRTSIRLANSSSLRSWNILLLLL